MPQTTYGAIHKVKTLSEEEYFKILRDEVNCYFHLDNQNTVYKNGLTINDSSINYLNSITSLDSIGTLRKLIEREYDDCESYCKGSGSLFLNYVFSHIKNNLSLFTNRSSDEEFENSLKYLYQEIEDVRLNSCRFDLETFFKFVEKYEDRSKLDFMKIINSSKISSSVFFEKSNYEETKIKKRENCVFDISFDTDFLVNRKKVEFKNFKFVIIDGFIDRVSEIHHLLYKSSETKQPFVLICKGMREEVKYTIIQNIMRGTINLFPISLSINEENVNITSDFASVLNGDVINHLTGDTISAAVRREMKEGKKIIIDKNKITIEPVDRSRVKRQILFLKNRIKESENNVNEKYLLKRIKCLSADRIDVFLKNNHDYSYTISLTKMIDSFKYYQKGYYNNENSKNYLEPSSVITEVLKKSISFLKIVYNIRMCIILEKI